MTRYFYKGKEINHLEFISIMRQNGLNSGWRKSHYEHLKEMAEKGNVKAIKILENLKVIK